MEERTRFQQRALALPTIREVIEALLRGSADLQTGDKFAPGCLIVQGALSTGEEADPIRLELTQRREEGELALRARREEGQASGDLPEDVNCEPTLPVSGKVRVTLARLTGIYALEEG